MTRLYRIDWSGECFVMAESEAEAMRIVAGEVIGLRELGVNMSARSAADSPRPSADWLGSLPFGGDERTVAQILAEQEASK